MTRKELIEELLKYGDDDTMVTVSFDPVEAVSFDSHVIIIY